MFVDSLLNQGSSPLMEQAIKFAAARQKLLADNMANISTPGYVQKDLSLAKFQRMLRERMDERETAPIGSTRFDDIQPELENPVNNILFHDRNNRSIEELASDSQKNALFHNVMIELLRKQMGQLEMALRERVT